MVTLLGDGHIQLGSGMVRSDDSLKPDYTTLSYELLDRWAIHMTKNIASKGHNNWKEAHTVEDLGRFTKSYWRHSMAWLQGDVSEDHAAAICFNVGGAEWTKDRLSESGIVVPGLWSP